jgi:hypothetical protein
MPFLSASILIALLFLSNGLAAIGCGGLLNLIPQAQVWIEDAAGARRLAPYKVFVHPMEGSIVLIREGESDALGLDKNKRHTVEVPLEKLTLSADGSILDVPENTPAKTLPNAPHFNRTYASVRLNDDTLLIVMVKR